MDALLVILGVLLGAVLVWLPVYICLQIWKMDKEIEYWQDATLKIATSS